jgi:hypothetical protein
MAKAETEVELILQLIQAQSKAMDSGFNSIRELMQAGKERNIEKQNVIEESIKLINKKVDEVSADTKKQMLDMAGKVNEVDNKLKIAYRVSAVVGLIFGGCITFISKIQSWF